jgi:Family of unknown function (DUF6582)
MSKMTTKARNALPASQFALPGSRKYPIADAAHAANAKARATQMANKGKLSASQKATILTRANKVLKRSGADTIAGSRH